MDAPELLGRLRRPVRWGRLALLCCAAVFLGLWFGSSPPGVSAPLHMVRGADGRLVSQEAESSSNPRFELHAGKLESQNSLSTFASSSNPELARFASRRLLIEGRSDHILIQRVARLMLDQLKQLDYVDQIEYLPPGYDAQTGTIAPDVFITLDLVKLTESGWLADDLEATIVLTASNSPVRSGHYSFDDVTPPVIGFSWQSELHHHSKALDVGSSAAKYKLQSEDIAKQLGTALSKQFDAWRTKYGELPELPADFYPAYHDPPRLPLEGLAPKQIASHRGLWLHNESGWRCESDRPLEQVLPKLEKRLQKADWQTEQITTTKPARLSMRQESRRLEVVPASSGDNDPRLDKVFYVRSRERVSRAERDAAIEKLFDASASPEILLLFERYWTAEQRKRLLAILAKRPASTPQMWLMIAKQQHAVGNGAEAKTALRKAMATSFLFEDRFSGENQIRSVAKSLRDEKLMDIPFDVQLLRSAGFIAWPKHADQTAVGAATIPATREFGPGEPLLLFHFDQAGKLHQFALRVTGESRPAGLSVARSQATAGGGRSWSTGQHVGETGPASIGWTLPDQTVCMDVQKITGEQRLKVRFAVDEPPAVANAQPVAHAAAR